MDYTVTGLLASVRRRASVPNSQQLMSDADLALLLSDEMQSVLVPKIMSANEEYFVRVYDQSTVLDQAEYPIPSRAIAGKLREVVYVGNDGISFTNIPRISIEEVSGLLVDYTRPGGFYPRNNDIVLYPAPKQVSTLRMWYYDRPLTLELVENCGMITAINTGTNEITVDNVPAGWAVGTDLSIVKGQPGFDTRYHDVSIVALSSPTIELASVEDLEVGDYVCPQGYSCIPQLPVEAHHVLAQAGVVKVLEALGSLNEMKIAQEKYNQLEQAMLNMITPRVDGAPRKVNNLNKGIFHHFRVTKNRGF